MALANQEARRYNHEAIDTHHILVGLAKEGSGVGANVLKNLDIDLRMVRLAVAKAVKPSPEFVAMDKLPQTPESKKVITYAIEESRNLDHNYVGTEHLLLGLLRNQGTVTERILKEEFSLKLEVAREEVLNLLGAGVVIEAAQMPRGGTTRTRSGAGLLVQRIPAVTLDGCEHDLDALPVDVDYLQYLAREFAELVDSRELNVTDFVKPKADEDPLAQDYLFETSVANMKFAPDQVAELERAGFSTVFDLVQVDVSTALSPECASACRTQLADIGVHDVLTRDMAEKERRRRRAMLVSGSALGIVSKAKDLSVKNADYEPAAEIRNLAEAIRTSGESVSEFLSSNIRETLSPPTVGYLDKVLDQYALTWGQVEIEPEPGIDEEGAAAEVPQLDLKPFSRLRYAIFRIEAAIDSNELGSAGGLASDAMTELESMLVSLADRRVDELNERLEWLDGAIESSELDLCKEELERVASVDHQDFRERFAAIARAEAEIRRLTTDHPKIVCKVNVFDHGSREIVEVEPDWTVRDLIEHIKNNAAERIKAYLYKRHKERISMNRVRIRVFSSGLEGQEVTELASDAVIQSVPNPETEGINWYPEWIDAPAGVSHATEEDR